MSGTDLTQLTSWVAGTSTVHDGVWLDVVNPVNEEAVASVADTSDDVIELALANAEEAQVAWASRTPMERASVLDAVASAITENVDRLVQADIRDTGKSREIAVAEMQGASRYFQYYAAELRTLTGVTIEQGPGQHTFVQRVPYGVVAVIVPWNYATNQTARSAAPALAMGNAVVVKPSELATSAVLELAELASAAGLPAGLLNVVTGAGQSVGERLVQHPVVRRISFTGSVPTGRRIAAMAAERLVPVGLELGGKSPHVVFGDADLAVAAHSIVESFTEFAGQTCSAGTRVLVAADVADQLMDHVLRGVHALDLQDDVGPLISQPQWRSVCSAIDGAVAEGASCAVGGSQPPLDRGFFVSPTVLTGVTASMNVFHEEVFGPVLAVSTFGSEAEAVQLANATSYGLVAAVWTQNLSRAFRVASQMACGQVFVNRWGAGERIPFGGFGQSGLGREKGAVALEEYTQARAVTIEIS